MSMSISFESFVDSYERVMMEKDDWAPKNFHRPIALFGMASLLGRSVYVKTQTGSHIYPSHNLLLVAPSGSGKGSYKNCMNNVIFKIAPKNMLWNQTSVEFMQMMMEKADGKMSGYVTYDEFGDILSACNPSDRNYRLNNFIMQLFETGAVIRVGQKNNKDHGMTGKPVILDSGISILGCIPPEEFYGLLSDPKSMNKGLVPRFMVIGAQFSDEDEVQYDVSKRITKQELSKLQAVMRRKVPSAKRVVQTEYDFTPEASNAINDIIITMKKESIKKPVEAALLNRIPVKTMKLALCLAVDRDRICMIDVDDVEDAYNIVMDSADYLTNLMNESIPDLPKIKELGEAARQKPDGLTMRDVWRIIKTRNKKTKENIIDMAVDMNYVEIRKIKNKRRLFPPS